jgi:hypothetical protein
MREIRLSGSEGGGAELNRPSLPYPSNPIAKLGGIRVSFEAGSAYPERGWPEKVRDDLFRPQPRPHR